eukprot:363517-Chlamydomonas_euryale.AAC.8
MADKPPTRVGQPPPRCARGNTRATRALLRPQARARDANTSRPLRGRHTGGGSQPAGRPT